MTKLVLSLVAFASLNAMAADAPVTGTTNSNNVASSSSSDWFNPGWSGKYKHGIGYSSSFLGTSTFVYDHYLNPENSFSVYAAYSNGQDSATTTSSTTSTTIGESNSGSKSQGVITLGGSYNWRIYRNEWTNIRIGAMGGLNYYQKVDYGTGSKSTTIATGVTTYSSLGTVTVKRSPQIIAGPVIMAAFNLRWFPMITAGMDGGIILMSDSKTKTTTSTQSGASNTAITTSTSTSETKTGMMGSTTGNGTFGFSTSFSIRYVW